MRMKRLILSLVAMIGVGLLAVVPVRGHHSFAAEFDGNQPIELRGTLTKVQLTNPHGWIFIDVKGPDGKVVNWAVETGPPNAMMRRGLRKTDFQVGSEIHVAGWRAKNGTSTANGKTIRFADGRDFFVGSSGTGAPPDVPGRRE